MTIGLAMNSVYYYKKKDGETFSKDLSDKEIEKQGKQMASEMLSRLRENSDLKDILFILLSINNQVKIPLHQVNL